MHITARVYIIKIFPSACFTEHQIDDRRVQESAIREFTVEFLKLVYYFDGGYIPLT